ncbi:MAG: quinone-dependent dihydroorotate dehydrogenase, partial [Campylobacterota bacterium]
LVQKNFVDDKVLHQRLFERDFHNPVGLAAGFDKDGDFFKALLALGFGYTEIGTVTPKPQRGNPKPRLFRLIEEKSLQNAMGFNNRGSYHMSKNLQKHYPFSTPVGINIGKNKTTEESDSLGDYETLFKAFSTVGDYHVVNISSPNTPGLRDLQNEQFIKALFKVAKECTDRPVLLKLAPDMEPSDAVELANTAVEAGAAGIIATNTTIDYSLTKNAKDTGGISGALLKDKSYELFYALGKALHGKTTLISAGGIDSGEEAYRRIKAGASLVQVYSALVYEGPGLVRRINRELIQLLKQDGYESISQAIGADL